MSSSVVIILIYRNHTSYFSKHYPPSFQTIQWEVGQGLSPHFSHRHTEVQRGFLTCQNLTAIRP